MEELKLDETAFKLLKVILKAVTRHLLERINSNLVSGQVSGVDDNFGSYEIELTNYVIRRIDLLETN